MTEEEYSFKISGHIIRQLGAELVSDDVTAIMELVKNAYDADASYVNIFIDSNEMIDHSDLIFDISEGSIIIEDSGVGMTKDTIKNSWLNISASFKREFKKAKKKTDKGREPLGDKGLGRLSAQRLGDKLEIITSPIGSKKKFHVGINWEKFVEKSDVSKIKIIFKEYDLKEPIADDEIRTSLIISSIPNKIDKKVVDGLNKSLSNVISKTSYTSDEFNVFLKYQGIYYEPYSEIQNALRKSLSEFKIELIDHVCRVKGSINIRKFLSNNTKVDKYYYESLIANDNGYSFFEFLSRTGSENKRNLFSYNEDSINSFEFEDSFKLSEIEGLHFVKDNGEVIMAHPGDFSGKIKEYSRNQSGFYTESELDIIKNSLGIKILKGPFAVKPYGFQGNDWLDLGAAQTSGSSFYGLRPQNTIGVYKLGVYENEKFEEKTDREGFVDNAYFKNFLLINKYAVNKRINDGIGHIRRAYNNYKKQFDNSISKANNPSPETNFERLINFNNNISGLIRSHLKTGGTKSKDISNELDAIKERVDDDTNAILNRLSGHLDELLNLEQSLKEQIEKYSDIDALLRSVNGYITELNEQRSQLIELASLGLTSETLSHEINHIITRLNIQLNKIHDIKFKDEDSVIQFVFDIESITSSLKKQLSHLNPSLKYIREKKSNIKLKNFLDELLEYYDFTKEEGIDFILELERENLNIRINKGRLIQVFDNLILNSIYWLKKSKIEKPKISIIVKNKSIEVFDNGSGIDLSIEDSIFEPFASMKPKGEGRGLGLYIVNELLLTIGSSISLSHQKNHKNRRYKFIIDISPILTND